MRCSEGDLQAFIHTLRPFHAVFINGLIIKENRVKTG